MSEAGVPFEDALELAESEVANLQLALEQRSLTSAAVGIVMERYGLDYPTAFGMLVRLSNDTNVRVFDLAVDLIDTGHLDGLPESGRSAR